MSNVLTIDKKTTISIGSLLVLIPAFFYGVTAWARQQSQTERNTSDITSLITKMDTLNTNLVETNQNVVKLTARIDDFTSQTHPATTTTVQAAAPQVITVPVYSYQPTPNQTAVQETAQPQPQEDQPNNQSNQGVIVTLVSNILGTIGGKL